MSDLAVLTAEPLGKGIVTLLENVGELATSNELSSLAIAAVRRDGTVLAEWSFAPSVALLIGAVARLQHRLHLEADA